MRKTLLDVAQEITQGILLEMRNHNGVEGSAQPSMIDILLQQLVKEVVKQLKEASLSNGLCDEDLEAKLQKAERKLEKLAIGDQDEDEDEVAGSASSYPNLKYARPKYKNIESILKYVERDEDKGGVKLVIMNFND